MYDLVVGAAMTIKDREERDCIASGDRLVTGDHNFKFLALDQVYDVCHLFDRLLRARIPFKFRLFSSIESNSS